jgi:hypothetical protein
VAQILSVNILTGLEQSTYSHEKNKHRTGFALPSLLSNTRTGVANCCFFGRSDIKNFGYQTPPDFVHTELMEIHALTGHVVTNSKIIKLNEPLDFLNTRTTYAQWELHVSVAR